MTRLRTSLGALTLLAFCAAPGGAWEVEVKVGLEGVLREDGWAPLSVRCRAAADDPPLSGEVRVDLGRDAISACSAPVRLAPGEVAVVHLVVPVGATRSYEARLVDAAGRTVATSPPEVALALLDPGEPLALMIGGDGLAPLRALGAQKGAVRPIHVEAEALAHLPDCVLDDMSALILVPEPGSGLRDLARDPSQVDRLDGYVRRGGTLLVTSGTAAPFWEDTPLLELLPVHHQQGFVDVPRSTFESLFGPLASDERRTTTIPTLAVVPRQAEHLIPGTDLLLRRRLGQGQVLFLAFDPDHPALRGAARAGLFLSQLVPPQRTEPASLRPDALETLAKRAFEGVSTIGNQGVGLIALALAAQLMLVGPIALLIGRRRGPWVALLAPGGFSLLVAAALFLGAALARGPSTARALVWSFQDANGGARQRISLGLFTGPPERFTLSLPGGLTPLPGPRRDLSLLQFRDPAPLLICAQGQPVSIAPVCVPARGLAQFELRGPPAPEPLPCRWRSVDPPLAGALPLLELEATAAMVGVSALVIGPHETRLGRLPELVAGARWTFDPNQALLIGGEARPAFEGDLWGDRPGAADALLLAVTDQLAAERTRALAAAPSGLPAAFPSVWLLRVDGTPPPLTITCQGEPAPLPVATRRITLWALEGGR